MLLDILHHHLIGDIPRAGCKVAPGPKVPPPKLAVQRLELHQNLSRGPSLDRLQQLTERYMRRYRHKDVDMVPRDVAFENLNILGLTNLSHQLPHPAGNLACQNRLAVFGDPYQVKFQIVNGMARSTIMFHTASLLKSSPEGEGFSPNPRRGQ